MSSGPNVPKGIRTAVRITKVVHEPLAGCPDASLPRRAQHTGCSLSRHLTGPAGVRWVLRSPELAR
jgi:hypothetical protein